MVVVLEKFAHHKKIEYQRVLRLIVVVEVLVAVLVAAPVYDCTVDGPHQKVNRQQEEKSPVHIQIHESQNIENRVQSTPPNARCPRASQFFEKLPHWIIFFKTGFHLTFSAKYTQINFFRLPHHRKHVVGVVGRVRVFFGVAESVVHPVQNGVRARTQVRRSLRQVGQKIKETLPELVHREHFMS